MYEGYNPGDDFTDDSEFDRVEERTVPSVRVPIYHNDIEFWLTPENAAVRLFFKDGPNVILESDTLDFIDEVELDDHSRVVVILDDDSEAPYKLDDDVMRSMVKGGFSIQVPKAPDETDREFMDEYMRAWNAATHAELSELQ